MAHQSLSRVSNNPTTQGFHNFRLGTSDHPTGPQLDPLLRIAFLEYQVANLKSENTYLHSQVIKLQHQADELKNQVDELQNQVEVQQIASSISNEKFFEEIISLQMDDSL
ncbi:14349_t:CDS:1 [Acaulospora colombiana]|uniref:14349_t:CDS:1 n=1 Tax=Acaulospora colombiana TaxID=27376 RepID=A0ACA9KQ34_9GLOM|nr:14349_t:CDS:1 [Acaulospora colombiana]